MRQTKYLNDPAIHADGQERLLVSVLGIATDLSSDKILGVGTKMETPSGMSRRAFPAVTGNKYHVNPH